MISQSALLKIRQLVVETFPSDQVPDEIIDLKLGDLPSWDSLGNFNLILAVESEFDIRFSLESMGELKSIRDIVRLLESEYSDV